MKLATLLLMSMFPWLSMAQLPTAATPLTDAIAHVESSFGKHMRSADGSHNGWHMMGRAAWAEINSRREEVYLPTHKYSECVDYATSSLYCYEYLQLLADRLNAPEDSPLVIAAYRAGAAKVKSLKDPTKTYAKYIAAVKSHLPK